MALRSARTWRLIYSLTCAALVVGCGAPASPTASTSQPVASTAASGTAPSTRIGATPMPNPTCVAGAAALGATVNPAPPPAVTTAPGAVASPIAASRPMPSATPAQPTPTRPGTSQPSRPPTSGELVDQAVAKGDLDAETALLYEVYAAFGDPRLPAAYQSDDGLRGSADALVEAAATFDQLSPKTQQLLAPFLLPPPAPRSWLQLQEGGLATGEGRARLRTVGLSSGPPNVEWGTVDTANGRVKVWYQKRYAGDDAKAKGVAAAVDNRIWNKLADLMGRTPLPDGGYKNNGGDSRLDIYLVHIADYGLATTYRDLPSPAFILLDSRRPLGSETSPGLVQTATHELMHAFEYAFTHSQGWGEYKWLREATSMWSKDFVYPKANSEHPYASSFLESTDESLTSLKGNRQYGAYLALYHLSKDQEGPEVVRRIWDNVESMDSLAAIDRAAQGTAETWWADLAVAAWNQGALAWFDRADGLKDTATPASSPTPLTLGGKPDRVLSLPLGVPYMSTAYHHLTFPDDSVSTVTFYNGATFDLKRRTDLFNREEWQDGVAYEADWLPSGMQRDRIAVQILYKVKGQDWRFMDATYEPYVNFCRDEKAERLEEMVVVFSNGEFADRSSASELWPVGFNPLVRVTNVGCWRWQGTMKATGAALIQGVNDTATTNVVFERRRDPYPNQLGFDVRSGYTGWQMSGTESGRWRCTYGGSASAPLRGTASVSGPPGEDPLAPLVPEDEDSLAPLVSQGSGASTSPVVDGEGELVIFVGILEGPMYRAIDGEGPYFPISYRKDCPPEYPNSDRHVTLEAGIYPWDFRDDEAEPNGFFNVGPDGRTLNGQVKSGGTYEWNLVAVRE